MKLYLFATLFLLLISFSYQQGQGGVNYGNGGSTGYGSGYGGGSGNGNGGSNNNWTPPQESGETTTTTENWEGSTVQESGETVTVIEESGETTTTTTESGETGVVVTESGENGEGQTSSAQTTTPVTVFPPSTLNTFIVDFHYLSGHGLNTSHPSFHYCFELSPGFTQCDLYNGTDSNSRLLGVELVVTLDILKTFDVEERKLWYPHAFEVLNGFVVIPNLSPDDELEVMKVLVNTYAKTIAFYPQDPNFPIGAPQLAFGWVTDQQVNTTLANELDQFLNLTTTFEERAKARQGLVTDELLEGLNSWTKDGQSPQFQVFTISVDTDTNEPL